MFMQNDVTTPSQSHILFCYHGKKHDLPFTAFDWLAANQSHASSPNPTNQGNESYSRLYVIGLLEGYLKIKVIDKFNMGQE